MVLWLVSCLRSGALAAIKRSKLALLFQMFACKCPSSSKDEDLLLTRPWLHEVVYPSFKAFSRPSAKLESEATQDANQEVAVQTLKQPSLQVPSMLALRRIRRNAEAQPSLERSKGSGASRATRII